MSWDRLRYEIRLLGIGTYALPIGILAIYVMFALFARYGALQSGGTLAAANFQLSRGLLALLENGLALGAGLIAAAAANTDRAVELHLSLPASYRVTVGQRLTISTLWTLIIGAVAATTIIAAGYWVFPVSGIDRQLLWLAPVLWFSAAGAMLTLLLRSRNASSAILGMLWIAQFLFKSMFLDNGVLQRCYLFLAEEIFPNILQVNASRWYPIWQQNRLILLGMALAFFTITPLLLRRNEALLGTES